MKQPDSHTNLEQFSSYTSIRIDQTLLDVFCLSAVVSSTKMATNHNEK